ncbi:hypothetical protein QFZ60_001614 [Arthrobacter sp. B2I5]|nr:hypothetical protein [Arthrobacter sp. B2I5]MDQ0825441.1 hypothetical protein [Arthrobacter sp. B2I5]
MTNEEFAQMSVAFFMRFNSALTVVLAITMLVAIVVGFKRLKDYYYREEG